MNVKRPARQRLLAAGAVLALAVSTAACSSSGGKKESPAATGVLTVSTGSTGNFVENFNPFSPNCLQATHGMIYEPLFLFNAVKTGDVQPWLGKSYAWSDEGKTLTIKIRTDATWNDGKPFTNKDVAFTFELMKKKDFDSYALPLSSVSAEGSDTVVLKFSQSAYTKEYFMLGKADMLPEHVWSAIPDAQKKTVLNKNPVGTGAWKVKQVAGMSMDLTARSDYYFKGLPKIKTLRYLSFSGNNGANAATTSGKIDWAGGFIPDIEKNYLAKNAKFDLVNIPLAVTFFVPNTRSGPTADVNVRKAISAALDRDFMSKTVYNGQAGPTNPMALLTPNYEAVLDPTLKDTAFETGQDKVDSYLKAAGYTKGSGGTYAKDGKKLSITLETVAGWTDYISIAQMAKQQLARVGIDLDVRAEAYAQWAANQSAGKFQMLLSNYGYTPVPYAYYDQLLDSRIGPKDGQNSTIGNYGGYSNPEVDAALDAIATTPDLEKQKPHFYTIQQAFVKDMPLIPLFNAQNEAEFNGNNITGYPTEKNPYAGSAIWLAPDSGWVAARIEPVADNKK
ncbi:ABC transporter substrate-binding protein [Peterkaempfera bronchialis]|uniref:ABC transporter substrate-binding protein n=1 Tax=Peterkaempfera bronchialis TaxID=2126346 RepID=A0A345ST38_9ACTN|nr:ABC transporter substrate-binding protein [Peterkaempfera bronchialis]AXI76893.1 ABC transporter substrate-binding protein [Peterkaempfera bronchialis]